MRAVSTVPAATEILYAQGIVPVGVSHECDFPPPARERPTVVDTRIDPAEPSRELSEQVARAADEAGVFQVHRDRLAALQPDLVVAPESCDRCAVAADHVASMVETVDPTPTVLRVHAHTVDDVLANIRRIGEATGRTARADGLVAEIHNRLERVRRTAGAVPDRQRPRVAVLDWLNPVMVAGHWVPELVAAAGGRYDLADPGVPARPREWATIRDYDPEVLVAAPCGFGLARASTEAASLADRPGWTDLTAVRTDRVYAMDGNQYVNRPGPRLAETADRLAAVLHPQRADTPPSKGMSGVEPLVG